MTSEEMRVGELAKRTGVSVRTLHYYEEIGLLRPAYRTAAGHRVYGLDEVARFGIERSLGKLWAEEGERLRAQHRKETPSAEMMAYMGRALGHLNGG